MNEPPHRPRYFSETSADESQQAGGSDAASKGGSRSLLWGLFALLAGAILLYVLLYQPAAGPGRSSPSHPAVGKSLESLEVSLLGGEQPSIALSDLSDKRAVIVNYWGPWCYPCLLEMPHILELGKKHQNDNRFALLLVACAQNARTEDAETLNVEAQQAVKRFEAATAIYYDPGAQSRIALMNSAELSNFAYPTTVLLDGEGVIQGLWIGYSPSTVEEMSETVDRLLAAE